MLDNRSMEGFPEGGDMLGRNRSEAAAGLVLNSLPEYFIHCTRERPVLCLLLMLGTLWMGYTLYQFKRRYGREVEPAASISTAQSKLSHRAGTFQKGSCQDLHLKLLFLPVI